MDSVALVSQVGWGHALLFACAAFYLAWWTVFFRDVDSKPTGALRAVGLECNVGAQRAGVPELTQNQDNNGDFAQA